MIYEPDLLDLLQERQTGRWEGHVFRHMFAGYPPDRENTRGARWNPAGVGAIYSSLERSTSLAEAEYHLSLQPVRPKVRRTMYRVLILVANAIKLDHVDLKLLGLTPELLGGEDVDPCQRIGGAVAWLGNDGLFVPSARDRGTNLVIFPANQRGDHLFEVVDEEVIDAGTR